MHDFKKQNQVTVCKDDICVTVVGQLAKAVAFVAIVVGVIWSAGQLTKILK